MKLATRRGTARSLRLKLTLWFLAFFSLLHALLLVAVVLLRRDVVLASNRRRIEEAASTTVDNLLVARAELRPETIRDLLPYEARFECLVLRNERGEPLVELPPGAAASLPWTGSEATQAGPLGADMASIVGERARAIVPGAARVYVLTLPFRGAPALQGAARAEEADGAQRPALQTGTSYLQAAVRAQEIEGALRPFLDLFVLGVPLASLAALLAAWMISGRAVQPLLRLSHAARDVSPSRLSERIVLGSTDEEVSALQRELNLALGRLETGYRAQEQFISNVSHELRTPIAVLRSQSQLLLEGPAEREALQAFAASVEEETQRLGRLVETFLALADQSRAQRLEAADELDAIDVLLDAVRHTSALAASHGVHLAPQVCGGAPDADPPRLWGDAALLVTMLENLVRNAIRFSPAGSTVRVQAAAEDERVVFRVQDEGPGIPSQLLERVFDRFVGWADPRGKRGTGIGLSIAREVAELHGGRVAAANLPGGGAEFTVDLPRSRGADAGNGAT